MGSKESGSDLLTTMFIGLISAFWLGLAGLVVGLILDFLGQHFLGSSSLNLMIGGAIAGGLGGGLIFGLEIVSTNAKNRRATISGRAKAHDSAERDRENRVRGAAALSQGACSNAVAAFEQLPIDLTSAHDWCIEARNHFDQHAYSPFWQAIEHAYNSLGNYNKRIVQITQLSVHHASAVRDYAREGGLDRLPGFPVELDAANATQAGETTVRALSALVYQAQRDQVFAQIWEQRRTTSAVIAGFANLDAAVSRMSSTLRESIGSLAAEVHVVSAAVAAASASAGSTGNAQLDVQKDLKSKVDQAVHYLREEERRAIQLR